MYKPPLTHFQQDRNLIALYWAMRLGLAFIWLWTAAVSWFAWPHAESLAWLRQLGLTTGTKAIFAAACVTDLLLGVASLLYASRRLWQFQFALVAFYSICIAFALPAFLLHPFGPITKNIAVLACLAWLALMESPGGTGLSAARLH